MVDVALGLLHFNQLRLALKIIEQEDAGIVGEAQARGDLGKVRQFGCAVGVGFFVDGGGFGDGGGGAVFLVFFGGGPVHQRGGKFFPLVAFGAFVADAVAFDFILGDELVGAVFEDETAGKVWSWAGDLEAKSQERDEGDREQRGSTEHRLI